MAFYLRRGINFGPLRVNFSKSGIGLSAGVTGARVGINSRGQAYVHGGRHGMYYRKNIGGKSRSSNGGSAFDRSFGDIFVDTGLTHRVERINPPRIDIPRLDERLPNWSLVLGIVLIVGGLISGDALAAVLLAIIGAVGIYWFVRARNKVQRRKNALDALIQVRPSDDHHAAWKSLTSNLDDSDRKAVAEPALFMWLEQLSDAETRVSLDSLTSFLPVEEARAKSLALFWYRFLLTEMLADHMLSEEEEESLKELEEAWQIDPAMVHSEHNLIQRFRNLRSVMNEPLSEVAISRELKRNEVGYFEGAGKLLRQVVLHRFQREGMQFRELGYREELSGTLRITSSVYEVDPDGRLPRSYPISGVEDICLNPEEGVVEVSMQNRQSPVIITASDVMVFATALEKVVEQHES
ncbi:MAG: DUF4236 domain-containing protein [Cryomorphaceae bacterium]|nr:MAG: DUF4236 domain-containing protein [Cryomorphaceae bacterium]